MKRTVETIVVEDHDPEVIILTEYTPATKQCKINKGIQPQLNESVDGGKSGAGAELKLTYFKPGVKFPHAREHCTENKFVTGFVDNNEVAVNVNKEICEQCYCFVCEVVASKCQSWSTGGKPHCNSFSKNTVWENVKRNRKLDANFIFNTFSEEDKMFGVDPSHPDPCSWAKLLDMQQLFHDYNNNKPVVLPCFCSCHAISGKAKGCVTCAKIKRKRCGMPFPDVRFKDHVLKSLTSFVRLCQIKKDFNEDALAAIFLDGITSILMLPGYRIEREITTCLYDMKKILERMRDVWIQLLVVQCLSFKAIEKLKERLQNVLTKTPLKKLKYILETVMNTKPWATFDELLASPTGSALCQTKVEAEARFIYLKKKKRWNDIIKCGSLTISDMSNVKPRNSFFYLQKVRLFLPIILAKLGKPVESVIVGDINYSLSLPEKIMSSICGSQANLVLNDLKLISSCGGDANRKCALSEFSETKLKNIVLLLRGEDVDVFENVKEVPKGYRFLNKPSDEMLKLVLIVTIRAILLNPIGIHNPSILSWLGNAMCTTNPALTTKENGEKYFTPINTNKVILLLKKAKITTINADDFDMKIPLQALTVQILVTLAVYRATTNLCNIRTCWLTEVTKMFCVGNKNEAYLTLAYACECFKISPPSIVVEKIIDETLPIFGVTVLPSEIYKRWYSTKEIGNKVLLKLWKMLLMDTKMNGRKKGSTVSTCDQVLSQSIRDDLGTYMRKLMDNIVKDPLSHERTDLRDLDLLCKTSKETCDYPMEDFHKAHLEHNFKVNPTILTYKALKDGVSKIEWESCKIRCRLFVKLNRKELGVENSLNIFYHLSLFKELTQMSYYKSDTDVLSKIHICLAKLLLDSFTIRRDGKIPKKTLELMLEMNLHNSVCFDNILSTAMDIYEQYLSKGICNVALRNAALEWLVNVKNLCVNVSKEKEFSRLYHKLLTGDIKRKKALIIDLSKCDTGDVISLKDLEAAESSSCIDQPAEKNTKKGSKQHK